MSDLVAERIKTFTDGYAREQQEDGSPIAVMIDALALIESQAANIAELERHLSAMTASRDGYAKQDAARLSIVFNEAIEAAAKVARVYTDHCNENGLSITRVDSAILALKDAGRSSLAEERKP